MRNRKSKLLVTFICTEKTKHERNQVELFVKFITKKNGSNRTKDVLRKQDKKEQRRSRKQGLHKLKH